MYGQAKNSMLMEWVSAVSMPIWASNGSLSKVNQAFRAWPASWVMTSTSPAVPLKFARMKGCLYSSNPVQ